MKRCVKWLSRGVAWTASLLVAVLFIGLRWGWTPVPKPPAGVRLEPLVPPLTLNEVTPDNAVFYYLGAVRSLASHHPSDDTKGEMDALLDGSPACKTGVVLQTIADCREALGLVQQGLSMTKCQVPWIAFTTNEISKCSALRFLSRLMCCEGKLAEQTGNTREALHEYLSSIRFADDCSHGSHILGRLVANAIRSRGCISIRQCVLQRDLPDEELALCTNELEKLRNRVQPLDETLRYELISSKLMFSALFTNTGATIMMDRHVFDRLWDAAFGDLILEAKKPTWQAQMAQVAARWDNSTESTWRQMLNRPLPSMLLSMEIPALRSACEKASRSDLEMDATILACAITRHRIAHAPPPQDLSDLVPEFLTAIPVDPFDGKPLRYRREGKEWIIWSVGADRQDDNAGWHEFKYRKKGDTRPGGDIYFKSSEAQDDLEWLKEKQKSGVRD